MSNELAWTSFRMLFELLSDDPTVDKCELLGEIESMRDQLHAAIDTMPTRATNQIPAIGDCDDVDLRLV